MIQKIAFVNPNYSGNPLKKGSPASIFLPNLGLDSIYHYLKEKHPNLDMTVIDAVLDNMSSEETIDSVLNTSPSIVGVSSTYINLKDCIDILNELKKNKKDIITVLGGVGAKSLYAITKGSHQNGLDYVVLGDGERMMENIIKNGKAQEKTKYLSDIIFDLDSLPINKRESIDMGRYIDIGSKLSKTFLGERAVHIWTSKGCDWGKCVFCTVDRNYRTRSVKKIKEELEYLLKKFKFTKLYIYDDNFLSFRNREKTYDLLEMLKEFSIRWYTAASIRDLAYDFNISKDILKKMKDSGCEDISLGLESGSEKMLSILKKGFTTNDAYKVIELIHNTGIKPRLLLMFNYPGETEKTINQTLDFVRIVLEQFNIPFLRATEYANIPGSLSWEQNYKENKLSERVIYNVKKRLQALCALYNTEFNFDKHG